MLAITRRLEMPRPLAVELEELELVGHRIDEREILDRILPIPAVELAILRADPAIGARELVAGGDPVGRIVRKKLARFLAGVVGDIDQPHALLDIDGFYSPLLELFDRAVGEGFIRPEHRRLVLAAPDPAGVLDVLAAWEPPPPTRKWVDDAVADAMAPDRDPA